MLIDHLGRKELMQTGNKAKDVVIMQKRSDFINLYKDDVRDGLNQQRSYIQSQMKKVCDALLEKGKKLPTVEDIVSVATRSFPLPKDGDEAGGKEYERIMEIFVWYWDVLLPCVAGNTYWNKGIRRTQTISLAADKEETLCIPPSTEAMCAVMYDNCYGKWPKLKEIKKKGGKIPKKKTDPGTKDVKGKYSDPLSGQSKYGGWSVTGLKEFNRLRKAVITGRALEDLPNVEKDCLGLVRKANQLPEEIPGPGGRSAGKRGQ
jgi:hypothetical protein